MSLIGSLLLCAGLAAPAYADPATEPGDAARYWEMLQDRQHPRNQSQAALLLVQNRTKESEAYVRQGLVPTENTEVFRALVAALRVCQDHRFVNELVTALSNEQGAVRQSAAESLAVLADAALVVRLQSLVEDANIELAVRQSALWILGHTGVKSAVAVLVDQLANNDPKIQHAAADALTDLTGQPFGFEAASWRTWWNGHKDQSNDRWMEERLAYQTTRSQRLAGDLERVKSQVVRLHQQLYARLPIADRIGLVQTLIDQEDAALRALAVTWSSELLPGADAVGQRALGEILLRLSRDNATEVQRNAVIALGRVSDPRVFERLLLLLKRAAPPVRAAAARALAQQARGPTPDAIGLQRQVVPALQQALDDPALEVVVEAAENLGSLGVPEAGPVLTALLKHPSEPVRQTAAQALERVADATIVSGLLEALDDPAVTVRFSLVGALGHAAGDGKGLKPPQLEQLLSRLEVLLRRDADPGVRSRAATVLGECGNEKVLPTLWHRILAGEDVRVQEKAWFALIEIVARSNNLDLLKGWNVALVEAKQGARRLELLAEVTSRWQKREDSRTLVVPAQELLVQVQLDEKKWLAAFPLVRELLAKATAEGELDQRMGWLLTVGELAAKEGNKAEVKRVVQEAQGYLARSAKLAGDFERLAKTTRP